jgi:small subunit ribosomal protein S6
MFVVDVAKGGTEFAATIRHIAGLLSRNGAQIERIERWDERKLAYPIRHAKRGIYVLVHFRAEGSAISEMRRSIELSEELLRALILKAEELSPVRGMLLTPQGEQVQAPPQAPAEEPRQEAAPAAGGEQAAAEHAEAEEEETEEVQKEV